MGLSLDRGSPQTPMTKDEINVPIALGAFRDKADAVFLVQVFILLPCLAVMSVTVCPPNEPLDRDTDCIVDVL